MSRTEKRIRILLAIPIIITIVINVIAVSYSRIDFYVAEMIYFIIMTVWFVFVVFGRGLCISFSFAAIILAADAKLHQDGMGKYIAFGIGEIVLEAVVVFVWMINVSMSV